MPVHTSATANPLSIGTGGRSSAAIFAGCSSSPKRRAASAAQVSAAGPRSGRSRQCSTTATPCLRSTRSPGSSRLGGRRDLLDDGQERLDPRISDHPLTVPALEAVLTDIGDALDAERGPQERDRPSADHRDATHGADEPGERVARRGQRTSCTGIGDDRRQRAVEVDEHCGARRRRDERRERGGHWRPRVSYRG